MTANRPNRSGRRQGSYHHGDLRAVLLQAGEAELAERGIEGFSLRGVAKRAGVSHAAPAHHFRNVNGLLTALAGMGFRRFIESQDTRQKKAETDALSQLVAAGLGYIDFAMANPALFRLMFSSDRPDRGSDELAAAATAAYRKLVDDVGLLRAARAGRSEPDQAEIMRTWAIAHGFADLMNSRRLRPLLNMRKAERDALLADMLRRSLG